MKPVLGIHCPTAIAAMVLCPGAVTSAAACSETPESIGPGTPQERIPQDQSADERRPASNLPYARGRIFHSLDEYLDHLERQGAIDLPWWRQVAPGVYERVSTRMPRGKPERATRHELMERFGFTR